MTPPFPIVNEDGDWFALQADMTRLEVAQEIAFNLADWYLDEFTWEDDDGIIHGWVGAYRALLSSIRPGYIRPSDQQSDWEPADWWFETDDPTQTPAWIVQL